MLFPRNLSLCILGSISDLIDFLLWGAESDHFYLDFLVRPLRRSLMGDLVNFIRAI